MTKQKLNQYRRKADVYQKYLNCECDKLNNALAEQIHSIQGFTSSHNHSRESAKAKELSWSYPGKGTKRKIIK